MKSTNPKQQKKHPFHYFDMPLKCFFVIFAIIHSINTYATEKIKANEFIYVDELTKGPIGVYPIISSFENIFLDNFMLSDNENIYMQNKNNFYIDLSVRKQNNGIIATIHFNNKSNNSFFIHRGQLPINTEPSFTCGPIFVITTENIALKYLKQYCRFDSEVNKDDWAEIPPKTLYTVSLRLNLIYYFPARKDLYKIETYSFPVANERWFLEQKLKKHLFFISDFRYLCDAREGRNYVSGTQGLCVFENNVDKLEYFMDRLYFYGGNESLFHVKSNSIDIVIDGDKLSNQ